MSEQDEKVRAEFEAIANKNKLPLERTKDGDYLYIATRDAWFGWQASRAQSDLSHQADREELAAARVLLEAQKREIERLNQVYAYECEIRNKRGEMLLAAQLAIEQKDAALKYAHSMLNDKFIYPRIESAIAIQPSLSALNEERVKVLEEALSIADDEARIRESAGLKHPDGSPNRDRCFAGARAAHNVAIELTERITELRAQSVQKKGGMTYEK